MWGEKAETASTDEQSVCSYGHKYKVDLAFADSGKLVSGATSSVPYKNKLILTGELQRHGKVHVCPALKNNDAFRKVS